MQWESSCFILLLCSQCERVCGCVCGLTRLAIFSCVVFLIIAYWAYFWVGKWCRRISVKPVILFRCVCVCIYCIWRTVLSARVFESFLLVYFSDQVKSVTVTSVWTILSVAPSKNTSSSTSLASGVPLGSLLGHFLFTFWALLTFSYHCYVDGIKLYFE